MTKFILPAVLAAALAFLPAHAQAGGISVTIGSGGYYPAPVYSGYGLGYYGYTPYYGYVPSVYYNYVPSYRPYVGSYYYSPYRYEWRGRDWDRHEWR